MDYTQQDIEESMTLEHLRQKVAVLEYEKQQLITERGVEERDNASQVTLLRQEIKALVNKNLVLTDQNRELFNVVAKLSTKVPEMYKLGTEVGMLLEESEWGLD